MTVTQFLNQALDLDEQIDRKREQLESLRTIAARCTSSLGSTPGGRPDDRGRLEGIAVRTADIAKEIEDMTVSLLEARERVLDLIFQLEDPTDRLIMQMKYVDGADNSLIASELHYTCSNVRKRHKIIIEELENRFGDLLE